MHDVTWEFKNDVEIISGTFPQQIRPLVRRNVRFFKFRGFSEVLNWWELLSEECLAPDISTGDTYRFQRHKAVMDNITIAPGQRSIKLTPGMRVWPLRLQDTHSDSLPGYLIYAEQRKEDSRPPPHVASYLQRILEAKEDLNIIFEVPPRDLQEKLVSIDQRCFGPNILEMIYVGEPQTDSAPEWAHYDPEEGFQRDVEEEGGLAESF
tara:strand:+ start:325 stop:948 length:624 start_codon:yes stop_codon:yes gene_type:complete